MLNICNRKEVCINEGGKMPIYMGNHENDEKTDSFFLYSIFEMCKMNAKRFSLCYALLLWQRIT